MSEEKVYSRIKDAEATIVKLCEKYPDVCWRVKPKSIAVYGIENKERSKTCNKLAKIRAIKGSEKAIFQDNGIPFTYVIEVYWADYNVWKEEKRQWILMHEILHIAEEDGKVVKHDCEDFRIILDKVGVSWTDDSSKPLPNLLQETIPFDLSLRPNISVNSDADTDNAKDG